MGIHDGHRERLRESFLEVGFKGKSEHEVLELLLTFIIPRVDVNPTAHQLIEKFGSLSGVLDADVAELTKVKRISKNGAVLLKMIPELIPIYYESKFEGKIKLGTEHEVKEYMIPKLLHEKNEVFYILCLDTHLNLIRAIRHSEGLPSKASLDLPNIVSSVLGVGATKILLVHNHLSGSVEFSSNDISTTAAIINAFHGIGIEVLDHLIFSGNKVSSFRRLKDNP